MFLFSFFWECLFLLHSQRMVLWAIGFRVNSAFLLVLERQVISFVFHGFRWEICCHLTHYFCICTVSILSSTLSIFSLYVEFRSLIMMQPAITKIWNGGLIIAQAGRISQLLSCHSKDSKQQTSFSSVAAQEDRTFIKPTAEIVYWDVGTDQPQRRGLIFLFLWQTWC